MVPSEARAAGRETSGGCPLGQPTASNAIGLPECLLIIPLNMKKIIIANWKMNPTSQKKAKELFNGLSRGVSRMKKKPEVIICPPFIYLALINNQSSVIRLGAQDVFLEEKGAFTGEVSGQMLKDLKVKYVLVGHSERRQIIGETDEIINQKLKALLKIGLTPVLCVGETAQEKDNSQTFLVLKSQIKQGLKKVAKNQIDKVIIAYEPVWAIGTGQNCSADQAITANLFIRKTISALSNKKTAKSIKVLYGGSVKPDNCQEYLDSPWFNGLLVGGASLIANNFLQIIKKAVR